MKKEEATPSASWTPTPSATDAEKWAFTLQPSSKQVTSQYL